MSDPARSASPFRPAAPSRRTDGVAVALGYDPESGRAPTVLASGRGSVAEQILAIAFAQGIKVREDADLAEILAAVDVDSEIPLEALAAVAEILSYVYRANGRLRDADDSTGGNRPDGGVGHAPHLSLSAWRDLFGDANADPSPARPAPSAGSGTAPDAGEPPHD